MLRNPSSLPHPFSIPKSASLQTAAHPTPERPLGPGPDGCRNSHSGWDQGLEPPLLLLVVQEEPVHDLVLLLWGDEVLDDQIPGDGEKVQEKAGGFEAVQKVGVRGPYRKTEA